MLLTNGFETRELFDHTARVRWNSLKTLNHRVKYRYAIRANDSEFFSDKRYEIQIHEVEPELTFIYKNKFRITGNYSFSRKENVLMNVSDTTLGGETSFIQEVGLELRYNVVSKSTLNLKGSYASVDFTGRTNTSVEYAMLQTLEDGRNYFWTVGYDRNLGRNLQLSIVYDGRKNGSNRMIHTGSAQLRAIF